MSSKKYPTKFPGVRYREHKSRKFSGKLDRYFFIRYRANGRLIEEGTGWASNGYNAQKAAIILAELKKAHLTGEGPQSLNEKRALMEAIRTQETAEKRRIERESIAFSEYFRERYYPEAKNNKARKSYKREDSLFRLWIDPAIGKMPFKDIRPFHIEKVKKKMANAGKAPRSIQYALAVIRQVFNHAIRNEIFLGTSPTTKVSKPKVENKRVRFLTHEEADILLDNLSRRSQQLQDMALVSLHCGLRAGEIFNLTWQCIDFEQNSIFVRDTKWGNRTVYMTSEVKGMLHTKAQTKPTGLVFKDRNGKNIKEISNAFGRAVKELGFNDGITDPRLKVYFHSLRHTYASWLVQNGEDLLTVSKLLGHSTISMTERYSHLSPDKLKSAVNGFEKSLKKNTESRDRKIIAIKKEKA